MKKVMLALAIFAAVAFSEGGAFQKGKSAFDLGFNLTYWDGVGAMAALDIGAINNMFSFGVDVSYHQRTERIWLWYDYRYRYRYVNPNFRFAFHPFGIPAIEDGKHD